MKVCGDLEQEERERTGCHVVHHDAPTARQALKLAHRRGLDDVERTKKYKGRQSVLPPEGRRADERNGLTGDFVDDDERRILNACFTRDDRGGGNANECRDRRKDRDIEVEVRSKVMMREEEPAENDRDGCSRS